VVHSGSELQDGNYYAQSLLSVLSVTYQLDKILVEHSEWAHVGSFVV
jgi:predicted Ser/Thr protein kinase